MGTYPALFKAPGGLNGIVGAMRAEEDAFIANVVFDSTKKFSELFTADYTFANDELAAYYGLPLPEPATDAPKVPLGAISPRGGMLTLGMFLMGHGRTNQSSPTQRGHMIRANMLCNDVPPPPPNVDPTVQPGTPGKTGRQQIEALTGSGAVRRLPQPHESHWLRSRGFDSAAQIRTTDNGEPVDTTGEIKGFTSATGAPLTFDGPAAFPSILARHDDRAALLRRELLSLRARLPPEGDDVGRGRQAPAGLRCADDLELPDLFVRVSLQDSFIARRSVEALGR